MIDISELHIGSHVLFNGERVEVTDISCGEVIGVVNSDQSDWLEVNSQHLDPIPITEELLTELGFEKTSNRLFELKKDLGDVDMLIRHCSNGKYRVEIWRDSTNCGNILCDALNIMESFVYLTAKQRLI